PPDPQAQADFLAAKAERAEQYEQLRREARAAYRAMEGWHHVEDEAAWLATYEQARHHYQWGRFLIDRLGAERHLDPGLMATLIGLRATILAELGTFTAIDIMQVDMALLGYYNTLRVQGWIGNLATL